MPAVPKMIPMAPLTQSTDEKPQGPLTLRVFVPSEDNTCAGDLYQDDGRTYDFRDGAYLRVHMTCSMGTDGSLTISLAKREGSFVPWWREMRFEIIGWTPHGPQFSIAGRTFKFEKTSLGWAATVPDNGLAQIFSFR